MMLLWPWAKLEQRAVCAERCTYGSGRRSALALLTPLPIGRGFLYLVAIIDWASRAVLAWRLSNTMDVSFCVAALDEALAKYGTPEIFNTDQGSQFTSAAFTGALAGAGIKRAGPGCLDSAPLDLSGFLPGYAERGALRFCRCVGRA
ncbi:hypothetical protein ABIE86_000069 [Bradyrhizobium diazoefficiens]